MNDFLSLVGYKSLLPQDEENLNELSAQTIINNVVLNLAERLTDQQMEQVIKLLNNNDPDGLENYLKTLGIDLTKLIDEETAKYQSDIITAKDILEGKSNE